MLLNVVLEKTLESPLDYKEIKPDNPKGNQSWIFIGRTDAEVEAPILWPPDAKNWLIGKDPDAGKDWRQEEKGTTGDKMVGWHHHLNKYGFEQTLGDGEGQGSLACCSPWSHKESDTTEKLNNNTLVSSQRQKMKMRFLGGWDGKESACNTRDLIWSLGQEDFLERETATYSSILAWRIPWTEEPGGLSSTGSHRVGYDWGDWAQYYLTLKLIAPLSQVNGVQSTPPFPISHSKHWKLVCLGLLSLTLEMQIKNHPLVAFIKFVQCAFQEVFRTTMSYG